MRKKLLIQPGPLYLFWTTGIFYVWSVKDEYDVVLLVDENYRDSAQFQKVASSGFVVHVEYVKQSSAIMRSVLCVKGVKNILRKYRFSCVLLHNVSYPENLYLLALVSRLQPKARKYMYQNGRETTNWDNDFVLRREICIDAKLKGKKAFYGARRVLSFYLSVKNLFAFLVLFKALPLLLVKCRFNPPINVYSGKVYGRSNVYFPGFGVEGLFCYTSVEAEIFKAQKVKNVLLVRHPMHGVCREVFDFLYGCTLNECDQVVLLPSNGFINGLIGKGLDPDDVVRTVSRQWAMVIKEIYYKWPGYAVKIKLHPGAKGDLMWPRIIGDLSEVYNGLEVINPEESAERYIVQSKVIVGDVSSTLWWAALMGGKIVVSFDVFGFEGGDELRVYEPKIKYVNCLGGLNDVRPGVCLDKAEKGFMEYFT